MEYLDDQRIVIYMCHIYNNAAYICVTYITMRQKELPPSDMGEELLTLVLQAFGTWSALTELDPWEGLQKLLGLLST